jgi:hypothetical protein
LLIAEGVCHIAIAVTSALKMRQRAPRAASTGRSPAQHPGDAQIFVELGPVNAHRHQLEAPARHSTASRSRGYHASGVTILRPSPEIHFHAVATIPYQWHLGFDF